MASSSASGSSKHVSSTEASAHPSPIVDREFIRDQLNHRATNG
jgi:hypothetical protein